MIYQAMKKSRANSAARRLVEMRSRSEYDALTISLIKENKVPHLPLNIDLRGMTVLVVGGGSVAGRKIRSLLDAEAMVRIVAPELTAEISQLAASGAIKAKIGCYQPGDLTDVFLAVAATNDPHTNRRIAEDARQRGMLVAVTDEPESGNCTFPALLRRGNLEVSVSTNCTCPGFSAVVRDQLASVIGEEYGIILATLALEREKLLTEDKHSTYNNKILRSRARELINELTKHKERVP
jgi:precorrin-2 dehydrogenase / sirohydrochlorin ferrochelatase